MWQDSWFYRFMHYFQSLGMIFVTQSIGLSIKQFLSTDISIYIESFTTTYVLWMIISSDRTADYNMNLHTAIEYGFSSGSRPWLTTHRWGRNMDVWGKCCDSTHFNVKYLYLLLCESHSIRTKLGEREILIKQWNWETSNFISTLKTGH